MSQPRFERKSSGFTRADILSWSAQLKTHPEEIESTATTIQTCNSSLAKLIPELKRLEFQMNPYELKVNQITARLAALETEGLIQRLQYQIKMYQTDLNELEPRIRKISEQLDEQDSRITKSEKLLKIKELNLSANRCQTSFKLHTSQLKQLDQQLLSEVSKLKIRTTAIEELRYQLSLLERQNLDVSESACDQRQARLSDGRVQLRTLSVEKQAIEDRKNQIIHRINVERHRRDTAISSLAQIESQLANYDKDEKASANSKPTAELERELKDFRTDKESLVKKKTELMHKVTDKQHTLNDFERRRNFLLQSLEKYIKQSGEFANHSDLLILQRDLRFWRDQLGPFAGEKQILESKIIDAEQRRGHAKARHDVLMAESKELLEGRYKLLISLRDEPEELVARLSDSIEEKLTQYDEAHLADQNENVRMCLAEYKDKLKHILQLEDDSQPGGSKIADFMKPAERRLYQICGLVWRMYDRLEYREENQEFALSLQSIFDLPCFHHAILDPKECLSEYDDLKMAELTPHQLREQELHHYAEANSQLQAALQKCPEGSKEYRRFYDKGQAVANAVNARTPLLNTESKAQVDLKFNTTILKATKDLLEQPARHQEKYKNIIKHEKEGVSSRGKRITGILFMFLGAAVIAASICAKVFSCGIASPVTNSGIAVGSGLFLLGLGLFRKSQPSGMFKQLVEFDEEAAKAPAKAPNYPVPSAIASNLPSDQVPTTGELPEASFVVDARKHLAPSAPLMAYNPFL
ncbi:MAG: hypothetical protein ACYCQI_08280 [Gammaproteobacteria bacterium]